MQFVAKCSASVSMGELAKSLMILDDCLSEHIILDLKKERGPLMPGRTYSITIEEEEKP